MERLARTDPQRLVRAEDISLVRLQLLAEMINDRSAHELGIVSTSSDTRFSSLERGQRTVVMAKNPIPAQAFNPLIGFDSIYVARTHLAILIGLFIAIPLSTYLLFKRIYLSTIWVLGFVCYGMYHAILYFRFYPEIDSADFFGPFIFKGLAIGFLYPAASLYISENVPKPLGDSRMMSGVIARVIFASLLGGAILGTFVSNLNVQHKTGLSQQLSVLNTLAKAQLNKSKNYYLSQGLSNSEAQKSAEKNLSNQTAKSSMMLAYKDIYLIMSALCFFPILVLLLFKIARRPIGSVAVEPIPF